MLPCLSFSWTISGNLLLIQSGFQLWFLVSGTFAMMLSEWVVNGYSFAICCWYGVRFQLMLPLFLEFFIATKARKIAGCKFGYFIGNLIANGWKFGDLAFCKGLIVASCKLEILAFFVGNLDYFWGIAGCKVNYFFGF